MGRHRIYALCLCIFLCTVAGCANSPIVLRSPFPDGFRLPNPLLALRRDNPADESPNPEEESTNESPFRRIAPNTETSSQTSIADRSSRAPSQSQPESELSRDAKLIALIEAEMPDATDEERYQAFTDLRTVDPEQVPQLLRTYRNALQMKQRVAARENDDAFEKLLFEGSGHSDIAQSSMDSKPADGLPPGDFGSTDPFSSPASSRGFSKPDNRESARAIPIGQRSPGSSDRPQIGNDNGNVARNEIASGSFKDGGHSIFDESGSPSSLGQNPVTFAGGVIQIDPEGDSTTGQGNRHQLVSSEQHPQLPAPNLQSAEFDPLSSTGQISDTGSEHTASRLALATGGLSPPEQQSSSAVGAQLQMPIAVETEPKSWQDKLQQLIPQIVDEVSKLEAESNDTEQLDYIANQVNLRMLYLIAGQQERSLEPIRVLEPADQEFWQQIFWAMVNYFDAQGMPDSSDRATETITQLKVAVQRLQEKSKLQLRNVAFCQIVNGYGNYDRFQRDHFSPGQKVLLYSEVENFRSELTSDGQYRTVLKSTVEIYRAGSGGGAVKEFEFAPTEDLCRNQRRDYFHVYEFTIPPGISLGPHLIKLTVEDQLNRKVATYSLNFTVE